MCDPNAQPSLPDRPAVAALKTHLAMMDGTRAITRQRLALYHAEVERAQEQLACMDIEEADIRAAIALIEPTPHEGA